MSDYSKELDKFLEEEYKAEKARREKDEAVLNEVRGQVSETVMGDIIHVIKESDNGFDYKITDKPKGEFQIEALEELGGIWVDQTTNGGYTGDEYAGTVSIEFVEGKYLEFNYSM